MWLAALLMAAGQLPVLTLPGASYAAGSSDWKQVSAGDRHTCGIRTSGRLYCWGSDEFGQLGDGGTDTSQPTPVEVAGGGKWVQVSTGYLHTCAVRSTGALYCWGVDSSGQLGDGSASTTPVGAPQLVAGAVTDWRSVSAGESHTCALRKVGRLYCWGTDLNGQLGTGAARQDRAVPTQIAGRRTDWKQLSAGPHHTCALRTAGRAFCWGFNGGGQLGTGSTTGISGTPTEVAGGRTDWAALEAGSSHTCALRTSGRLFCWGDDSFGQLGDGAAGGTRGRPGQVIGGARDWARVAAGGLHTCAVKTSGRTYCWGIDFYGELGDGEPRSDSAQPVQLAGGATDWRLLHTGSGRHTCAVTSAHRLYCWGSNDVWQLGTSTSGASSFEPVEVHS